MLIAQTNANLPTLYRYFRLRAKMLGVPQLHYYDIYPPLVHGDFKFPLGSAKATGARGRRAARPRLCRGAGDGLQRPLDGCVSAPAQAIGRAHGRLCLRRASVRADELQRRLRVADDAGARMGPRDALVPGQPRPAVRDGELPDLHRRDRVDLQRGAAARAHAEDGEDATTNACSTSARRSRACARRSSGRRCSPISSATCMRASTRASRSPAIR